MIPEGTILYPTSFDNSQVYYNEEPYGYWLHSAGEWVLYKEYDSYVSICNPNDCICAINKEELLNRFRTFSWFKNREELCRTFNQRSLEDNEYEFEDFSVHLC